MTVFVASRAICMHEKPRTCFPACQSETVVLNLQSRVRIPSPLTPSFALACIFLITHLVPMNYSTIHDVFPRKYTDVIKLHATLL